MANVTIDPLQELQKKFGLLNIGGVLCVIDLDQVRLLECPVGRPSVDFVSQRDAKILLARFLQTLPVASREAEVIRQFLISPLTRYYCGVSFDPLNRDRNRLNLWVGPVVAGAATGWSTLDGFLREVVCDANSETYEYLLDYLAHMIQKPEDKPGVMPVFLGGQGIGKGTFFRLLRRIWAHSILEVSDVEQVLGRFNAALERSYVVVMDEALFKGDRRLTERLKALVTEPYIRVEEKMQPSRETASYHRFFAASNSDHFLHISADDRRLVFFRVSDHHRNDFEYFRQVRAAIDGEMEIAGLVKHLQDRDITGYQVRKRPQTQEQGEQKLLSLGGIPRQWHQWLERGRLGCIAWPDDKTTFVGTATLASEMAESDPTIQKYEPLTDKRVRDAIRVCCPSALPMRKLVGTSQQRGLELPALKVARAEFERYLGSPVDWNDGLPDLPWNSAQPARVDSKIYELSGKGGNSD